MDLWLDGAMTVREFTALLDKLNRVDDSLAAMRALLMPRLARIAWTLSLPPSL